MKRDCILPLLLLVGLGAVTPRLDRPASAADVEILTPHSGATIAARKPVTHLVLRQRGERSTTRLRVEAGKQILEPTLLGQAKGYVYAHFQIPLKPGPNFFTIAPGGLSLELHYLPLRARIPTDGKKFAVFHRDEKLPESCDGCHSLQNSAPVERLGIGGQESCLGCHGKLLSKAPWQHSLLANKECLACHQQSATPWRIGFPTRSIEDTCFACHTRKKSWLSRKFVHGPMVLGGCTLCHDPHGDENQYQLWAEGKLAICVACHSDKAVLLDKAGPVPYVHGIILGAGCTSCHDPHATDQQFMLRKPVNQLCVGCHPAFADISEGHPVGGHPVMGPRERRRPNRALGCASCHDPHGSKYKYLLVASTLEGELCRECHKR